MKITKKKLLAFIKKTVKEEVQKQVEKKLDKQKTDIISEVVSYMNQESFSGTGSQTSQEDDVPVDTDDPVLKRVLKKNKQKEKKKTGTDVAKEIYEETDTRDPETIREKILEAQQNAVSNTPETAGQDIQQQRGQVDVQGPLAEGGGANPTAAAAASQHATGGGNPMQGGQPMDAEEGYPSEDEFQASPGQVQQNPNMQQPQQAPQGQQQQQNPNMQQPAQQPTNRRRGVNPNNAPDYLQDVANRDYSELVDRFDDQN